MSWEILRTPASKGTTKKVLNTAEMVNRCIFRKRVGKSSHDRKTHPDLKSFAFGLRALSVAMFDIHYVAAGQN